MNARPTLEVADVIRAHGEAFLAKYGTTLTAAQRRALRDLAVCRSAALGGHVERCAACGATRGARTSLPARPTRRKRYARWPVDSLGGSSGHLMMRGSGWSTGDFAGCPRATG